MAEDPASPLFFAVPAPPGLRDLAARAQDDVRRALGPARFPPLEGLHVTLAFLGPMDPARVPGLLDLAAEAAAPCRGFTLRSAGTGGFPRPARARILWLGFDPQPALGALADRLREALRVHSVPFDPKPFQAHLTLARFREPVDLGRIALTPGDPVSFGVDRFGLWQSERTPRGSRYHSLGELRLTC
jgi:2'-5' RNA ligase